MATTWGPPLWNWLHRVAGKYPVAPSEKQMKQARRALLGMQGLVPCGPCRESYADFVKANPPDVSSREALSRWVESLHNYVNTKVGRATWSRVRARLLSGPGGFRLGLALLVSLLVGLSLWWSRC